MEIKTVRPFLDYYENVRKRTLRVIECIPAERLEWTYAKDKFTFGDLIRHLAAAERYIFVETARLKTSRYPGHGRELADGYDSVVDFMHRMHAESIEILSELSNEELLGKCLTPGGTPISVCKWLRAMVEHEIHHRGQIYVYLAIIGIATPPLYGLTSEEVLARSQ